MSERGPGHQESSVPRGSRPTRAERARVPLVTEVERRAGEFVRMAAAEVQHLPALTADEAYNMRVLWRAYQLANRLPPVTGETLLEVYVLERLRSAVTAAAVLQPTPRLSDALDHGLSCGAPAGSTNSADA